VKACAPDQTARMRVIFFANPSDLNQAPKSEPDSESNGARWVSLAELQQWITEEKLRGDELLEWGIYLSLENGGPVYSLSLFTSEETVVAPPAVVASVVSSKSKGVLQPAEGGSNKRSNHLLRSGTRTPHNYLGAENRKKRKCTRY